MTEVNGNINMKRFKDYIINEWKLTNDSDVEIKKIKPESYNELRDIVVYRYEKNNKNLDLRDIDVSNITSFGDLYEGDSQTTLKYGHVYGLFCILDKVETINILGWKPKNLFNTVNMFLGCTNLKNIIGIETLNMSNTIEMANMFRQCENLEKLDVSKWNLPTTILTAHGEFYGCKKLKNIKGIENWKSIRFKRNECMFGDCPAKPTWYK